jgi:hypothetical protein
MIRSKLLDCFSQEAATQTATLKSSIDWTSMIAFNYMEGEYIQYNLVKGALWIPPFVLILIISCVIFSVVEYANYKGEKECVILI